MPQAQLPLFPEGFTAINQEIGFQRREGKVYYFNGHLPVFVHEAGDLKSFRFFTTQLIINGTASQAQIIRAFAVPKVTVKRYVKLFRTQGPAAFFQPAKRREGKRLNGAVQPKAQALLDAGGTIAEISAQLGVLPTTLHKALDAGRLRLPAAEAKKKPSSRRRPPPPKARAGCSTPRL
jgi:hypothetical protein